MGSRGAEGQDMGRRPSYQPIEQHNVPLRSQLKDIRAFVEQSPHSIGTRLLYGDFQILAELLPWLPSLVRRKPGAVLPE